MKIKKSIVLLACILTVTFINAQTIYSKAYGNSSDDPLIFLHGGPGYNAVGFEVTTAQKLSESGFYVIVYDRRGEGRSPDKNATFTFEETFNDLEALFDKFHLKSASLIGHSFGGVVATLFADKYPSKVNSIILAAAPLSIQETFLTILKLLKSIYFANNDSVNLNYISMLEQMDKNS
jgi:proline iminopeptidase